ncbi:uncharacterized protein LOC100904399 [Galendromus occidentalis]|uniref:Uncharacterized protein LOC100904399 n=1 Tax=Galendromus occidentalis TaxID=34638 RepID=A0AAJ6QM80_9ACAR|nr:uncharacterized protein LOC100904399 [Galendromus occidentalis]
METCFYCKQGLKTRVVKDASARRSNQAGLNDVLHCGPNLLQEITKVILKFRQYRFAFTADIEKAFLQFRIADSDKTFLSFLWPLNISEDKSAKIRGFWATRLDFGLICSPFLHCQGIRFHLESSFAHHPEDRQFIEVIRDNFYMDDVIGGANSFDEAKHRIQVLTDIFTDGHFPLDKWSANSTEIGEFIERMSPVKDLTISIGQANHKTLGVPWNQVQDELGTPTSKALRELTTGVPPKRKLLRATAQIVDPLGIISPIIGPVKSQFQELWEKKIGWDEALKGNLLKQDGNFSKLLSQAEGIAIPRHMLSSQGTSARKELFMFSDASLRGCGIVAYIREQHGTAPPSVSFVLSKSKIAPVEAFTIHRLELLGALLAARMAERILEWLDFKIEAVITSATTHNQQFLAGLPRIR